MIMLFCFSCKQKLEVKTLNTPVLESVNIISKEDTEKKLNKIPLTEDSLFTIFNQLGLCAKVSQKDWDENYENGASEIRKNYQCRCDFSNLRVYPLANKSSSLFLLEIRVNHGSGEYDNFVIQRFGKKYKNIQTFKAYIDTTFGNERSNFKIKCAKKWNWNAIVVVLGKWQGDGYYQDSTIEYSFRDSLDPFINIPLMLESFSENKRWN